MVLAFDTTEGGTSASYNISGDNWDARVITYPFSEPLNTGGIEFLKGADGNRTILCPIDPETSKSEKPISAGSLADATSVYVEQSIPLTAIGSPSGTIKISMSFGWTNIGTETLEL